MHIAVNCLEMEASLKLVSVEMGVSTDKSAKPYPFEKTTSPWYITRTQAPGPWERL